MAEEQFTSRRARREAERQAAEQAFEAREVPEQPQEAPNSRADLFTPRPPKKPETAPQAPSETDDRAADTASSLPAQDTTSRIDPAPAPKTSHERGALASDHPQESRPPVHAEDRLDPQRSPLPHFQSRAEKKRYLREHGLSLYGDLSTGAMPVVADEKELAERQAASEGRLTGPLPEVSEDDTPAAEPTADHESYDTAGFGGDSEEVAARDFEAPVTADSAPRPTTLENEPYDALSMPFSALDGAPDQSVEPESSTAAADETQSAEANTDTDTKAAAEDKASAPAAPEPAESKPAETADKDAGGEDDSGAAEPAARSRRMPIVQPPSTSGVRVVTAASAQIPTTAEPESSADTAAAATGGSTDSEPAAASGAGTDVPAAEPGSDDAARALAANPETRPMDAVPEAWALPNSDYEDEETENPPGSRIRASSVTGHDGQILMGEEPSKVPYIVLGIAAFFALALIVVAFVLFQ
jgi:hypothetical protein